MADGSLVVLCVEDDFDTQEMFALLLGELGYGFEPAGTCADAMRLLREREIALVLLDNWLPDGTGLELCKQVRAFDKRLPIIFVSGAAQDDERVEALKSGANAFLTKPVAFNEFFALLKGYAPI